jgi:uncharacterized hydrophobic protein (TIGR00271 family)
VLRLSVSVHGKRHQEFAEALGRTGGVRRLITGGQDEGERVVVAADVIPANADQVMALIDEFEIGAEDYLLTRHDIVAPSPVAHHSFTAGQDGIAWIELVGEAREHSRPIGRYLALMSVAAVIAGLGVIKANTILIVGAMAVSPDLLPICALCVGLAVGRPLLARRALVTLTVGLGLVVVVAAALTALLHLTGFISDSYKVGGGGLGSLAKVDYSTVVVAAAAGVAAMLSFETRASAAVGVAISVTTIPASAYLGVAIGINQLGGADGAALVLLINVALLVVFGTLTLRLQRYAAARSALGQLS